MSAATARDGEPFGAHLVAGLDEPARRSLLRAVAEGRRARGRHVRAGVRPEVHVRVGPDGALRTVHALRRGRQGTEEHQGIPCGADVHELRRFGPWTPPSRFELAWWYCTRRPAPSFRGRIDGWAPSGQGAATRQDRREADPFRTAARL